MSDSLQPHVLQHTRLPCLSPTPSTCSNSCPLSQWCHPTISSSVAPLLLPSVFSNIRVFSIESALHIRWPKYWSFSFNIRPSNEHPGLIPFRMDWLDLLVVQGLSRVFSNTTIHKHQFFGTQLSSVCHQDYISSAGDSKITLLRRLKDTIWSGRECLGDLTGTWICIADILFLYAVIGRVGWEEVSCSPTYHPLSHHCPWLQWWFPTNQNYHGSQILKKYLFSGPTPDHWARISWVESEILVFKSLCWEIQAEGILAPSWQVVTSYKYRVCIQSGNISKHIINALIATVYYNIQLSDNSVSQHLMLLD